MANDKMPKFLSAVDKALQGERFVKLSLGHYRGADEGLKNIFIKKILVKKQERLSFTYHYKTRDIVKNYTAAEGRAHIRDSLNNGFYIATLFTPEADLIYENIGDKKYTLRENSPSHRQAASLDHNREKKRLITSREKSYLVDLKITNEAGNVFKNAQDKYRQINKYVEILGSLIKDIPTGQLRKVVDMGSGKGYLTFALYDYLRNTLNLPTQVIGVECRQELVDFCNQTAHKSKFSNLHFVQGTVEKYDSTDIDILIALHACDTATDDALCKGIKAGAELIVVAPCCHKQIRREIEKHKAHNELDFLTKHGIFLERQAEMVTDGLRAMILEYFGYTTKVFEFISDAHTPKNVLIVGTKNANASNRSKAVLNKIKETKAYFGIEHHHLERMMGI
jgi:16S rRNA G527 N7-methylase RsmG